MLKLLSSSEMTGRPLPHPGLQAASLRQQRLGRSRSSVLSKKLDVRQYRQFIFIRARAGARKISRHQHPHIILAEDEQAYKPRAAFEGPELENHTNNKRLMK